MLTLVDKRNGWSVFKVTSPKQKVLGYRAFPDGGVGDSTQAKEFQTLEAARSLVGVIEHNNPKTPPKSVNPQNQPGYSAPRK